MKASKNVVMRWLKLLLIHETNNSLDSLGKIFGLYLNMLAVNDQQDVVDD